MLAGALLCAGAWGETDGSCAVWTGTKGNYICNGTAAKNGRDGEDDFCKKSCEDFPFVNGTCKTPFRCATADPTEPGKCPTMSCTEYRLACENTGMEERNPGGTMMYDEVFVSCPLPEGIIVLIAVLSVAAVLCIFCTMFCMPFVIEKRTTTQAAGGGGGGDGFNIEVAGMHSEVEDQLVVVLKQLSSNGFVVPFEQVTLERKIAAGASGQVYKATYLNTPVAVKELFSALMNPEDLEEFNREALMLSTLHHPYIMQFFGISQQNGHLYLVTKFYDGTLTVLIDAKKLARSRALELASHIGQGMMYMHSKV